jgi:hypothetical protein
MPNITPELKKVIDESDEDRVELTDPQTNSSYVLLKSEVYERMRALCEELEVREFYPMINELAGNEGWNDPAMEIYNEYQPPSP